MSNNFLKNPNIINIQYVSDNQGNTTGVFIPISEWNSLKEKFKGIEEESVDIPEWHKELVRQRLENYRESPGTALDFDSAMDAIDLFLL